MTENISPEDLSELTPDHDEKLIPFLDFSREIRRTDIELYCHIRIPNQFHHQKIQRHALAARARRVLEHKDADSDAASIVQEQISSLEALTDDDITTWLVGKHEAEAIFAAKIDLDTDEIKDGSGDSKLRWPNMEEQQDRYRMMIEREETDSDEFKKLEALLLQYAGELQVKANAILDPYRDAYAALDREGLHEKVRRAIIKADCQDEFINIYNQWQIFFGTRNIDDTNKMYFEKFEDVIDSPSHIVECLTDEFARLDALKVGELKKSPGARSLLASLAQSEI